MATYKEVINEEGTTSNFYRLSGTDTIANDTQSTDVSYDYEDMNNKPTINGVPLVGDTTLEELGIIIPDSTSDLTNDAGFITKEVDDLINYYTSAEINKKLEEKQDKLTAGKNINISNNIISTQGDRLPIYAVNINMDFQDDGQGSLVYYNSSDLLDEFTRIVQDAKEIFNRFELILNINHTPVLFTVDMEATLPLNIKPGTICFCGNVTKGNELDSRKYSDYTVSEFQQSLYLALYLTWTDDMVTIRRASLRAVAPEGRFVGEDFIENYYLNKYNTKAYAPVDDFNPATKKYVDDLISNFYSLTTLRWANSELTGDYNSEQHEIATALINQAYNSGNVTYVLVYINESVGSVLVEPFVISTQNDTYYLSEVEGYRTVILGEWVGNVYECTSMRREKYIPYLAKNNTDEYIPTETYNPATKGYVDELLEEYYDKEAVDGAIGGAIEDIDFDAFQKKLIAGNNIIIEEETNTINAVVNLEDIPRNNEVLRKDNTSIFVPTGDYNPTTKKYVDDLVANIEIPDAGLRLEIVEELPTENIETNVIYLILDTEFSTEMNVYQEWVYLSASKSWEQIGTTAIDLTPYALTSTVLTKDNTTEYTPSSEYHPTTKKYVDDLVTEKTGEILNDSGLITNEQEKDPIFTNSPAFDITEEDKTEWDRSKNLTICPIKWDFMNLGELLVDRTYTTSSVISQFQSALDKFGDDASMLLHGTGGSVLYHFSSKCATSSGTMRYVYTSIITQARSGYSEPEYKQMCASALTIIINQSTDRITSFAFHNLGQIVRSTEVLTKSNTITYSPTTDYNPSTKKYVDDAINALEIPDNLGDLSNEETKFITNEQEQDPIFRDSPAYGITDENIADWNRINNIKICPIILDQDYDLYNNTVTSTNSVALNTIAQYAVEFGMQNVLIHITMPGRNVLYYYGATTSDSTTETIYTFNTVLYNNTNIRPAILNIKYNKTSATFTELIFTPQSVVANKGEVLTKTNATTYTPTGDYNPATKKYVDDVVDAITLGELDNDAGFITIEDVPEVPEHILAITEQDITKWNKAEEDPHFIASPAADITKEKIAAWDTAAADTPFKGSEASTITADMINKWNADETDPIFSRHVVAGITQERMDEWDAKADIDDINGAISGSGFISVETDPNVPAWVKSITEDDIASWNSKAEVSDIPTDLGDLNNEEKGYLTSSHPAAKVTDAKMNAWTAKQDALVFNTAYHPTANPVATMADILAATPNVLEGEY